MRKIPGIIFLALLLCNCSGRTSSLHEDFSELFERCRLAVEQSTPLEKTGLQPRQIHKEHSKNRGNDASQTAWALPNSELYIVFTDRASRAGQASNVCTVHLYNPKRILTEDEQARLIRLFLLRQTQLIGQRTHNVDQGFSHIPPIINLVFLLSEKNPRGCTVASYIAIHPDGTFFTAASGEQTIKTCDKN